MCCVRTHIVCPKLSQALGGWRGQFSRQPSVTRHRRGGGRSTRWVSLLTTTGVSQTSTETAHGGVSLVETHHAFRGTEPDPALHWCGVARDR